MGYKRGVVFFVCAAILSIMFVLYILGEVLLTDRLFQIPRIESVVPPQFLLKAKTPFARLWPDHRVTFPPLGSIISSYVPENAAPDDFAPLEINELDRGTGQAKQYRGVGLWFRQMWQEQTEQPMVYSVEENKQFIAKVDVVSYVGRGYGWFMLCLLDFQQIPCGPGQDTTLYLPDNATSSFTIETHPLASGLHQVDLVRLADHRNEETPSWILEKEVSSHGGPFLITVNGQTEPPPIQYVTSSQVRGTFGINLRMVDLHTEDYPLNKQNEYTPIDVIAFHSVREPVIAHPGEAISFYLHLNNPMAVGIDYAVLAIMDRQQVIPIYVNGQEYSPLFVHNKSYSWQTLKVSVLMPMTPGSHNLQTISFPFPYVYVIGAREAKHPLARFPLLGDTQPGTLISIDIRD